MPNQTDPLAQQLASIREWFPRDLWDRINAPHADEAWWVRDYPLQAEIGWSLICAMAKHKSDPKPALHKYADGDWRCALYTPLRGPEYFIADTPLAAVVAAAKACAKEAT